MGEEEEEEEERGWGQWAPLLMGLSPLWSFMSHDRFASPLSSILQGKKKEKKNKKSGRIEIFREEMEDGLILFVR